MTEEKMKDENDEKKTKEKRRRKKGRGVIKDRGEDGRGKG
jgi:hypothetical protein